MKTKKMKFLGPADQTKKRIKKIRLKRKNRVDPLITDDAAKSPTPPPAPGKTIPYDNTLFIVYIYTTVRINSQI